MKRFFLLIFALALVLCQNVGDCQAQTGPSDNSNPPLSVVESQDSANNSPKSDNESAAVENEPIVRGPSTAFVERLSKIADKADFALVVAIISAIISALAWLTGKSANEISERTLDHTRLSERGWLDLIDLEISKYVPSVTTEQDGVPTNIPYESLSAHFRDFYDSEFRNHFNFRFKVKNVGKSVIRNASFEIDDIIVTDVPNITPTPISHSSPFCYSILPDSSPEFTHAYRLSADIDNTTEIDLTRYTYITGKISYYDGVSDKMRFTGFRYATGGINCIAFGEVEWSATSHT